MIGMIVAVVILVLCVTVALAGHGVLGLVLLVLGDVVGFGSYYRLTRLGGE